MSEDLLQATRQQLSTLLDKPTDGLSAAELLALTQASIVAEREVRKQTKGGGATMLLNTLLALEAKQMGMTPAKVRG